MTASLCDYLDISTERLARAGVINPRKEVDKIVRCCLGLDDDTPLPPFSSDVSLQDMGCMEALIERRMQRIPLERLLGEVQFEGVVIGVEPAVFRPYPETGVVVEHAVALLKERAYPVRILDLGTGTGCILLALLYALPQATGIGVDNNKNAIILAQKNAVRNQLQERASFFHAEWGIDESWGDFDLIISNPPRVATNDLQFLIAEMRDHDPQGALDGGQDGLQFFRLIAEDMKHCAKKGGFGLFQAGPRQMADVVYVFREAGYKKLEIKRDFSGQPSCIHVLMS